MSSATAAVCEASDPDAQAWDAAGDGCAPSAERRLKMLDRLAEAGLKIALAIEKQVEAAEPARPIAELNAAAMAYGRAARAVRLAILLQAQLAEGAVDPLEAVRQAEIDWRKDKVERTVRIVRRIAKEHCRHEGFALGCYAHEARERLDNDDIYGLVATRPLGELVAMICDDLGLQPDWDYLAAEAWAQAEIESGAKGSPFLEEEEEDDEDEEEDEDGEAEEAAEAASGPPPPAYRPPTFQEAAREAASHPAILAVAGRRESG